MSNKPHTELSPEPVNAASGTRIQTALPSNPGPLGGTELPTIGSNTADEATPPVLAPVGRLTIAMAIAATFGASMAAIVPMMYTLALRLSDLAPGSESTLGYILGIGATVALIATPLTGIISDRMRSRFGRRRPFALIGLLIGLGAVPILATAETIVVLGVGWILTTVGWGTVGGSVGNWLADTLPERQRGSVSGMTNLAGQISAVVGILLAGAVSSNQYLVVLLPAVVGAALVLPFLLLVREPDSRHLRFDRPLSPGTFFRSLLFNPRHYPTFAWVWVSRLVFFFGLSLTNSYVTYFYAQRLGLPVPEVATVMAAVAGLGLLSALLGALGAGWASDRTGSRKAWTVTAVGIFAIGCVVSAFAWDLPWLIAGSIITSLGIAAFGSVGQALVLDTLPHRETQAGRFLAITSFSQRLPAAGAPLLAPILLAAVPGKDADYVVLYLMAAGLATAAGIITLVLVRQPGRAGRT